MSKKKGLGQHVEKSLTVMDDLAKGLKDFAHMPLKKGLVSNDTYDDDIGKLINSAKEEAFALINKIDDLKHKVKGMKKKHNSRFARNVVARFLESKTEMEEWVKTVKEEKVSEDPEKWVKTVKEKKVQK